MQLTLELVSLSSVMSVYLQVLFALHDVSLMAGMQLAGVTVQSIEPIHTGTSKVDIFLELFGVPDGSVVGQIEYDIEAMAADLQV